MKDSPSRKLGPDNMNPASQKVWKYIIHRYSDLIFGSHVIADQWFRSRRMFEQACKARELEPYTGPISSSKVHEISANLRSLVSASLPPEHYKETCPNCGNVSKCRCANCTRIESSSLCTQCRGL